MAVSLNALSLIIGMNTDQVLAGVSDMRKQIGRASRIMQMAKTDTDKLTEGTKALTVAYHRGNIDQEKLAKGLNELQRRYGGAGEEAKKLEARQRRVQSMLAKAVPETTQLAMRIRDLRKEYNAGNVSASQFRRANMRLREEYRNLKHGVQQTGVSMAEARRRMEEWRRSTRGANTEMPMFVRHLTAAAAAFVSLQGVRSFFGVAMEAEKASLALEAYTGSAETARQVVEDLQKLDARSPLGFTEIQKASETIMGFGGNVKTLIPTLERLGDISGGNTERFNRLALVFAQIQANGKLMGQDLNQMIQSGFNPLQQIAIDTGKSMTELRKEMENGQISAQQVAKAIESATSRGGRFFQFMARYSESAAGALSKAKSQAKLLAVDLGRLLLPALTKTANAMAKIIESVRNFGRGLSRSEAKAVAVVAALTSFVLIVPRVVAAVRTIIVAIRAYTAASITAQAFAGPAGWASIAAGAAIAAATIWGVDKAFDSFNATLEKTAKNQREATQAGSQYERFVAGIQDTIQDTTEIDRAVEGYRQQWIELKRGAEYAEDLRLALDGATAPQLAQVRMYRELAKRAQEAKEAEEERKALIEKNRKSRIQEQKQYVENLKRDARNIQESMRTPFQVAQDSVARLMEMMRAGFIDAATFAKQAQRDFAAARGEPPAIAGIEAGSEEAFKFITGQIADRREQQLAKMEEQRLLQMAQLEEQKRTNRQLAGLQPARRARG